MALHNSLEILKAMAAEMAVRYYSVICSVGSGNVFHRELVQLLTEGKCLVLLALSRAPTSLQLDFPARATAMLVLTLAYWLQIHVVCFVSPNTSKII